MTNKNTIRYVVENLKHEDLIIELIKNMTGEDISNLLTLLDSADEHTQELWMDAIRKVNIWI